MPLARARCEACSEPLGDPPYAQVPVRCVACGRGSNVTMGADGAPPHADASFSVNEQLRWFERARVAMSSGQPGVAVGPCPKCQAPLVVSSRQPIALPCPHCRRPREGTAADLLVDQWPEPWTKVEGAGISLEYRLAMVDDATAITAGCAACGAATPPNDPSVRCARCGACTWAARSRPDRRVQLGVRIDGDRDGRPLHALVSVVQGEAMLRADAARTASDESGRSMLGVTGLGCAIAVALAVVVLFGASMAIYFVLHHR